MPCTRPLTCPSIMEPSQTCGQTSMTGSGARKAHSLALFRTPKAERRVQGAAQAATGGAEAVPPRFNGSAAAADAAVQPQLDMSS